MMTFRNCHHNRDDGDDDHHDVEHQRHAGSEADVDVIGPSHRDLRNGAEVLQMAQASEDRRGNRDPEGRAER